MRASVLIGRLAGENSMSKIYVPSSGAQSWQALLADPEKQWKIGYSARTIAYCWEAAGGLLPTETAALFGGDAELLIAIPEHKVSLGDSGRPSQTDVFALVKSKNKTIAVAIEGNRQCDGTSSTDQIMVWCCILK